MQFDRYRHIYTHTGPPKPGNEAKKEVRVRAGFRGGGGEEKGSMAFVECLGVLQEDTMEGPLWKDT